jgi:hypothetical protein
VPLRRQAEIIRVDLRGNSHNSSELQF